MVTATGIIVVLLLARIIHAGGRGSVNEAPAGESGLLRLRPGRCFDVSVYTDAPVCDACRSAAGGGL